MANKFDSANYPKREPLALIAGDRWAWKRDDLTEYAAGDYTLKYAMRLEGSGSTEIEIEATANGNGYLVEVGATLTKVYSPGVYHWQAYISRNTDNERITIDGGVISVEQNRDLSIADPRSHYKIVLDNIEAVIEKRATKDQESYSINGRSLTRTSIDELIRLRDTYRAKYITELNQQRARQGKGHRARILTRFN